MSIEDVRVTGVTIPRLSPRLRVPLRRPGGLKIVVHSAISGRPLAAPILDQRGEGKGTVYFSEEPRVFFMEVTSADVDWKISVSERLR
jgi:hypothetical protein